MTGRMKHLAEIVRVIHLEVIEMGSSLHAIYIASKENDVANAISRTKEYHNWEVLESDFQKLEKKWRLHTIDRFANHRNSKLGRFNSRFINLNSEGIDALVQNWSNKNNYVVPPIPLIPVVSMKIKEMVMKRIQTMVTIVVPKWQGQPWFQLLKEMVVETMELEEVIKNNATWKFEPHFIALRIFGQSRKDCGSKKQ
jgi:hypothetical protein